MHPKTRLVKMAEDAKQIRLELQRHRISHEIFQLPKNKGSLGIPDIQLYFEAAQLTNTLCMLTTNETPDWMVIGLNNPKALSVHEIFWMPKHSRPTSVMNNPFCTTTLKIWDKWKTKLTGKTSALLHLSVFSGFPKKLQDVTTSKTTELKTLRDLTKKGISYQK